MKIIREKTNYDKNLHDDYFLDHQWNYLTLSPRYLCSRPSRTIAKVVFFTYQIL